MAHLLHSMFLGFQMWLYQLCPIFSPQYLHFCNIFARSKFLQIHVSRPVFHQGCGVLHVKSSTVLEINLPFWRKQSISALIKVNSLYSYSFLYLTMHEIRE